MARRPRTPLSLGAVERLDPPDDKIDILFGQRGVHRQCEILPRIALADGEIAFLEPIFRSRHPIEVVGRMIRRLGLDVLAEEQPQLVPLRRPDHISPVRVPGVRLFLRRRNIRVERVDQPGEKPYAWHSYWRYRSEEHTSELQSLTNLVC